MTKQIELPALEAALRRAFLLGQTYWQQADSEYSSQHKKADETLAKFKALIPETLAAIAKHEEDRVVGEPVANVLKALRVAWTYAASPIEHCKTSPSSSGWMIERASEDETLIREALATTRSLPVATPAPLVAQADDEVADLLEWYDDASGFSQGTKAHHKWVLRAEQALRRLAAPVAQPATEPPGLKNEASRHVDALFVRTDASISQMGAEAEQAEAPSRLEDAATTLISAYVARFRVPGRGMVGPIDDAVEALAVALNAQPTASNAGEREAAGGGFAGDHNGVLTARIKELEGIVEKLTDSECDKIMAMTEEQISALHRMEGHDPEDIAKLGKLTARLAIRDVQVAQLRAALASKPPQGEQKPVASIYVTLGGEREFDDWKCALPVGRNLLYPWPQPEQMTQDKEDAENYRWLCTHMIVPAPSLWDNGVGFVTPALPRKRGAMTKPELDEHIRAARARGEGERS